jgi:DNA-binding winged helix-turn-helix (wHTH) protein
LTTARHLDGGGFVFDAATGEIHRGGAIFRLEPQPAAMLALLMARPGELVTRQDVIRALWGEHTSVSFQDGLNYNIRQIRLALGDQARQPRFVETIPRRGYRFLATVDRSRQSARPRGRTTAARWVAAALAGVLLAGAIAIVERRPNRHHELAVAILKSVHARLF